MNRDAVAPLAVLQRPVDRRHAAVARKWPVVQVDDPVAALEFAIGSECRSGRVYPDDAADQTECPEAASSDVLGCFEAHVFRLQEITVMRRIAALKSRLQRTNPVERATEYNRMFGDLVALEQHRRTLREKAIGGDV